jgi:DNA gyrase subunit A
MCTELGTIKKTLLEAYSRPRAGGIHAINVKEGDMLLAARLTNGNSHVMLASTNGKLVRFHESTVRPVGRVASGVRGITLAESKDAVVGMITMPEGDITHSIMVVSENGYGKRSELEEYRITNRGAKGVKTINITEKTGALISIIDVQEEDDLMIINRSGITIRMPVSSIRVAGRATQGVRLISIPDGDSIAAIARVDKEEIEEGQEETTDAESGSGTDSNETPNQDNPNQDNPNQE